MDSLMTQAVQTALAGLVTPTPLPTETPLPTVTLPPRTPPALPPVFTTNVLNPLDTPHTYMDDTCQYLQDRWNPQNAQPGTIVMVVMLHSVNKDGIDDPNDITVADFRKMMNALKEQNFEAITAVQLADFLDHNAKIPQRSVLLIQDDRHYAENFNQHFRPYWEQWGWPVVNAWISVEDGIRNIILAENIALAGEGWVDYQSHGTVHNIPMGDSSPEEYIRSEFQGSLDDLQRNFNKTPVAIIWPGGGFGVRPAQIGREFGYRLGFTVNPRGPLMYNWVPLADQPDPGRPSFLPEGPVGDPRMTLPRYWPNQVLPNIDTVRNIGNEAAAYAEQNKAVELEYYDIVCAPTYGSIPQ
jgi:peptidoglycan/xylan/chitin deacetylase (PgdA/CDA1 family)